MKDNIDILMPDYKIKQQLSKRELAEKKKGKPLDSQHYETLENGQIVKVKK